MGDEVPRPAEPSDAELPTPDPPPAEGLLAPDVSTGPDELRQLIDAGASSPEELRALAARIREHKAQEEQRWRSEVRPALLKSKKRAFSLRDLRDPAEPASGTRNVGLGLALLGGVLVLLLAASQSSFLWILVPVAAVVVFAYQQGRKTTSTPEPTAPSAEDPPT